jgi:hypothetical protein
MLVPVRGGAAAITTLAADERRCGVGLGHLNQ